MTATDLYAIATQVERRAMAVDHQRDPETRRCLRSCWRCFLDAKARLHGRAGDNARELEAR